MPTFTTPVGRLVGGSTHKPRTTDDKGQLLLVKTGPNAGKPRTEYSFALAIPKGAEQHWSQTSWGAPIHAAAVTAFPRGEHQHPTFSWKIQDGDSATPNRAGKRNCDKEGHPGHWVIWFSSGIAPRLYRLDSGQPVQAEPESIKTGYYAQVFGEYRDNMPSQTPGLYMSGSMVCMAAFGPEIVTGVDVSEAGFGGAPLPAGASAMPAAAPAAALAAVPPVPVVVPPNPAILAVPVPPPAPAAPVRTMTAKATAPYDAYIAQGWTDDLLRQHGMML